ncbi:hypothetical protein DL771_007718 [Monosporascus sp. 5C6A]|nr:hypothetical protein DL771_007718 [Monosporascus sp. 5C6A]
MAAPSNPYNIEVIHDLEQNLHFKGFLKRDGAHARVDLGGLVCANFLNRLRGEDSKDLLASARGVIFFGTPFMDAGDDRWDTMARTLSKLTASPPGQKRAGDQANPAELSGPGHEDQDFDCRRLSLIVEHFGEFMWQRKSMGRPVLATFFCETLETDGVGGCVVDEDAAVLSSVGGRRLDDVSEASCIEADHVSLCKYPTSDCENYQAVEERLAHVLFEILDRPGMDESLASKQARRKIWEERMDGDRWRWEKRVRLLNSGTRFS